MLHLSIGNSIFVGRGKRSNGGRRNQINDRVKSRRRLRASTIINLVPVQLVLFLLFLALSLLSRTTTTTTTVHAAAATALECELYIAASTIPNAGLGIFSGLSKKKDDFIGNGDKAIPLIDVWWHNGQIYDFFNPMDDYTWDGSSMGMGLETLHKNDLSAFWPGIDAMVNCNAALLNTEKATPRYDEGGLHRAKHPGAGGMTPYNADQSILIRDIPIGGELFKNYGDDWFLHRTNLGQIPVESHYGMVLDLISDMIDEIKFDPSIMYNELIREFQTIWDSRMLNALYDFTWKDVLRAIDVDDIGILLQNNATRSVEWLNENGKCIDHIVHGRSTIDGAGHGAFAKRDLPIDTIVTGTPLIHFPDGKWFDTYEFQYCNDGHMVRNMTDGPYGKQLLLNYCFSHPESTLTLCPYGSGVNYINHNKTKANVKVQWSKDGITNHHSEWLLKDPNEMTGVHSTNLAIDYVTIRDVVEGEELFLDYGDVWEDKWNELIEGWKHYDTSYLEDYVSATEYNLRHGKDRILSSKEQQLYYQPYPDNLLIRCHYLLELSNNVFDGDDISFFSDWENFMGDNNGFPCHVLNYDNSNESYLVEFYTSYNVLKKLRGVPREAIKFADRPYSKSFELKLLINVCKTHHFLTILSTKKIILFNSIHILLKTKTNKY